MFEFELYLNACHIHSEEFATHWANNWKEYNEQAERQQEGYQYTNCRSIVLDTGRQFERHLSTIMHHRSHQQEF